MPAPSSPSQSIGAPPFCIGPRASLPWRAVNSFTSPPAARTVAMRLKPSSWPPASSMTVAWQTIRSSDAQRHQRSCSLPPGIPSTAFWSF